MGKNDCDQKKEGGMAFVYRRRHWWWVMPPVLSILSAFTCMIGLVTNHWIVLNRVPYTSGERCDIKSSKGGVMTSMLMSGNFCNGKEGCGVLMIILGVMASVGCGLLFFAGVYGLTCFCRGKPYAHMYHYGVMLGFLLTAIMLAIWFSYMSLAVGLDAPDHTCSGYSVYVFVGGCAGGLLCWALMCMPIFEHLSDQAGDSDDDDVSASRTLPPPTGSTISTRRIAKSQTQPPAYSNSIPMVNLGVVEKPTLPLIGTKTTTFRYTMPPKKAP